MKKNIPVFVAVLASAVMAGFAVLPVSRASAYAIGSPSTAGNSSAGADGVNGYNFGNSLQNLISPFTGFINNLKWNNTTLINAGGNAGGAPSFAPPNISTGPQLTNMLTGWLSAFDDWFYKLTSVPLSGIIYVLLNAISWTLHMADSAVNWLLGLFH